MVSFSCENCGDVLTKKKLDYHRTQCYGASFTCLDCMIHFEGTGYQRHNSCISEAQKYEGALYKGKKSKNQKQNPSSKSQALVPRNAYVEDAPDDRVAIVDAPPHAPSPPPVNVFDFLIGAETPKEPKAILPTPEEPREIDDSREHDFSQLSTALVPANGHPQDYDSQEHFAQDGYSYGNEPVQPTFERYESYTDLHEPLAENFYTPAPKYEARAPKGEAQGTSKKTDKKRKRGIVETLDMALVRAQAERDAVMTDAPPLLHSGLTGGIHKLLTHPDFPPSPDYSGGDWVDASPLSPMKRTKQIHMERDRGRNREPKPRKPAGAAAKSSVRPTGWVRRRDRDDSGQDGKRSNSDRQRRRSSSPSKDADLEPSARPLKAIEYHPQRSASPQAREDNALVKRDHAWVRRRATTIDGSTSPAARARADLFMSFVTKGPESERGCSVNKALKRYHRERADNWDNGGSWGGMSKADEEKELWKNLRLRRNDQGEIVLFFES